MPRYAKMVLALIAVVDVARCADLAFSHPDAIDCDEADAGYESTVGFGAWLASEGKQEDLEFSALVRDHHDPYEERRKQSQAESKEYLKKSLFNTLFQADRRRIAEGVAKKMETTGTQKGKKKTKARGK